MNLTAQLAKHLREVHFGGNWTSSNLTDQLGNLTWQQATKQVYSFNSILALVYHMNYYVKAIMGVLQREPLDARDKYSFDHPSISSQEDWEELLQGTWADAEKLASLVEQLPQNMLGESFSHEKYGNYYRNLLGVIEHIHYHLGQVVLIKKLVLQEDEN